MESLALSPILQALGTNFGLCAGLILVYGWIEGGATRHQAWHDAILGAAFGLATVLAMLVLVRLGPGVIVHIGVSFVALSGLFGGGVAAAIAAGTAGAFRYHLGGGGAVSGIAGFAVAAAVGVGMHWLLRRRNRGVDAWALLGHLLVLLPAWSPTFLLLPGDTGWTVLARIGPQLAAAQAVGTLALGAMLMQRQRQRELAARLRESEERSRTLLESAPNALVITDRDGVIRFVNAQTLQWFGYTREELLGQPVELLVPERFRGAHVGQRASYTSHPVIRPMGGRKDLSARRKDGSEFPVDIHLSAVHTSQGLQVIASIVDMTEARAQRDALQASEDRLRAILNSVPGIIFRRRIRAGQLPSYVFFGGRLLDLWGLTAEEVVRDPQALLRFLHPDDQALVQATLNPAQDDLQPRSLVHRMFTPDGGLRWIAIESRAHHLANGEVVRDGIILDVTKQKLAEEQLRDSEFRYRMLAESISDQIIRIGADGKVLYSSPSGQQISGYSNEERARRPVLELVHPDDIAKCRQAWELVKLQGIQTSVVYRLKHKDGHWVWAEANIRPLGLAAAPVSREVVVVVRNIDQRKAMEDQLRQAQRMEAIGQLTGGVAHEFNNLLMAISGGIELLDKGVAGNPDLHELVTFVQRAVQRGAGLTRDLLAFSRKQPLQPSTIDAGTVVADLTRLARGLLGESIDLKLETDPHLLPVNADSSQLQNAVLNLIVNARDAMPTGGQIVVTAQNVNVSESEAFAVEARPGPYVQISVRDTGAGMPPEVLARAVEPFFSTKEVGKGTGLGLSMVHGFSKQSGGYMAITSDVGKGTEVRIFLPAAGEAAGVTAPDDGTVLQGELSSLPQLTVLVAEDDPDVLSTVGRMLRDLGHRVIEAEDGTAALRALDGASHVDLLLTDVVMPNGMSGLEVARAAQSRRPGLKVVYMSAYNENVIIHQGVVDAGVVLLWKPFRREDLAKTLHDVWHPIAPEETTRPMA